MLECYQALALYGRMEPLLLFRLLFRLLLHEHMCSTG
jgi:hypothetical protein